MSETIEDKILNREWDFSNPKERQEFKELFHRRAMNKEAEYGHTNPYRTKDFG